LIVGLQDADKIGHAGSILVFGRNRNLSVGRKPVPLLNPEQEISDFKRRGGGRYAADLVLQLPARSRFRCFALRIHR
jgi:hypothetical protein